MSAPGRCTGNERPLANRAAGGAADPEEAMTENFPVIDPDANQSRLKPTLPECDRWIEQYAAKCLFDVDAIRSGAIEFRYADQRGPNCPGVYFLLYGGEIVYVGKAASISNRLRSHSQDKVWTHFWCITGIPVDATGAIEGMYIAWLRPIANVGRGYCEDIGHDLIKDLAPYRPYRAMRCRGGWVVIGDERPCLDTHKFYVR